MTAGLTLEQARIKLNMPNASDAEVMVAAKNAGIEISVFNKGANTLNLSQTQSKGSLFNKGSAFETPNFGAGAGFKPQTFGANSTLNNNNIFNAGSKPLSFNNQSSSLTSSYNTTFNQNVGGLGASSGLMKYKFGTDSKQSFDNKFDVDSYLFDSFKNFRNFNAYKPKTYSESEKIDMSKVVKFEVGKGGKHIFTMEDGTTVEKHLSEEALQRFQESPMANVSSIVSKDGRVITYDKSGNVIEDRDAHKGERGYVKDGLSIEEDLVEQLGTKRIQKFSEDKEKIAGEIKELQTELATLTDDYIAGVAAQNPKEAEKLKRRRTAIENEITKKCDKQDKLKTKFTDDYIKSVVKECKGDINQIREKIHSLVKNSGVDTNTARQMTDIISGLKDLSDEDLSGIVRHYMSPTSVVDGNQAAENADAMAETSTRVRGKNGHRVRAAITDAARETGNGDVVSEAFIRGSSNAIDPETGNVDAESLQDINENAIAAATDKDRAATNIANNAASLGNDRFTQVADVAVTERIAASGNEDVAHASARMRATIQDEQILLDTTKTHHETLRNAGASDETIKMDLEVQGEHLSEVKAEHQVKVDEINRNYDVENAYNRSVAKHGQDLSVDAQKVIVQRTVDSGDEEAINNVADNAYEYDLSNRDDIIKMLKEKGYESTQKALDDAKKEYEAQIAEEKAKAEVAEALKKQQTEKAERNNKENSETKANKQATTTSTINISNKKAKVSARELTEAVASGSSVNAIILSDKFRNADPQDRAAFYNNLSVKDKQMVISSIVEKSNAITLKSLMFSGMKKSILSYLVSHPSSDNNAKLKYLENYLTPADKKELEDLKEKQQSNVQAQREEVENKQHKPFMFEV